MFGKPSLVTRIAVGKLAGLVFGLIWFLLVPLILPEANPLLRWGVLLWYVTLGAIIGVFGVISRHPILAIAFPWWVRAPLIGGWMNFLLALLMFDALEAYGETLFGAGSLFASPFWGVLEGALVGLAIGYAATRAGGEGPETARTLGPHHAD